MKLIPLTQGYFAKVDDADFVELNKVKWHRHNTEYEAAVAYNRAALERFGDYARVNDV